MNTPGTLCLTNLANLYNTLAPNALYPLRNRSIHLANGTPTITISCVNKHFIYFISPKGSGWEHSNWLIDI